MTEALYKELKKGGQEPFKKKVLFKLNYCIGLICLEGTCTKWIVSQQREMIRNENQELAYLLFQAVDGRWIKGADDEVRLTIEFILEKLTTFLQDN